MVGVWVSAGGNSDLISCIEWFGSFVRKGSFGGGEGGGEESSDSGYVLCVLYV